MEEDNVKDKAPSTESTTGANSSSSSGISSTPATSVNSAVDDKKDKPIFSGASTPLNNTSSSTPAPAVKVNIQQEVKYPIQELIKNTKALTGHKREVAVGALFDCTEKELTKDNFKKIIDAFLKRKVK